MMTHIGQLAFLLLNLWLCLAAPNVNWSRSSSGSRGVSSTLVETEVLSDNYDETSATTTTMTITTYEPVVDDYNFTQPAEVSTSAISSITSAIEQEEEQEQEHEKQGPELDLNDPCEAKQCGFSNVRELMSILDRLFCESLGRVDLTRADFVDDRLTIDQIGSLIDESELASYRRMMVQAGVPLAVMPADDSCGSPGSDSAEPVGHSIGQLDTAKSVDLPPTPPALRRHYEASTETDHSTEEVSDLDLVRSEEEFEFVMDRLFCAAHADSDAYRSAASSLNLIKSIACDIGSCNTDASPDEMCTICLEPMNARERRYLNCLHSFHQHCIIRFIALTTERLLKCPLCRRPIFSRAQSGSD